MIRNSSIHVQRSTFNVQSFMVKLRIWIVNFRHSLYTKQTKSNLPITYFPVPYSLFPIILIFLLTVGTSSAYSQTDSCTINLKDYTKSYFSDTWGMMKSPLNYSGKNWLTLAAVTGTGLFIHQFDKDIQVYFAKHNKPKIHDLLSLTSEPWGTDEIYRNYSFYLLAGMYTHGLITDNCKSKQVVLNVVKASVLTAAATEILKSTIGRHRPYQDNPPNPNSFSGPAFDNTYKSFPSGHTSFAFAAATVFAEEYKQTTWVPILAYTSASLTGFSRIYHEHHWSSDVFFGAAIGYFIGKYVVNNSNYTLIPKTNGASNELALLISF